MQYVKQVRYYQDIGNQKAQLADIEQNLIRGVHGPAEVHVVFVES